MKNKKIVILLVLLCAFQLLFPLSFVVNERLTIDNVFKEGKSYTLDFTRFEYFNPTYINTDTGSIYTVGYNFDREEYYDEEADDYYIPHDTIFIYDRVGIIEKEDGTLEFFDAENCDKAILANDNWFRTYHAFQIELKDYEFADDNFGLKELFELALYCGAENYNGLDFEGFTSLSEGGYYEGVFDAKIEGKIVIKVYDGYARVSELYIGDELILRRK